MDLASQIARYACSLDAAALPDAVLARTKRHVLDSLACVLGAFGSRPAEAATALAATAPVPAASVFGSRARTTPDLATFANGTMVRYLDYNDGYMGREPGHPSDNIAACLALAEAEGAGGRNLIAAIVIAYEVQMRLQDTASLNDRGWDHVNYVLVSAAAASARLLSLDPRQATQAINMALNGHIALRQVRSGELTAWKGASAANAARNAVFCAQLARFGMDGPAPIFEGRMGFVRQVAGALDLDTATFATPADGDFMILRAKIKRYPTNGELQTAVQAALDLRPRLAHLSTLDEIAAIHVDTTAIGHRILASDPQKWHPSTRETADHSLPYNVARALLDGEITIDSYGPAKIADPSAIALMKRTTVAEDPALTASFPEHLGNRVTLTLSDGRTLVEEVTTLRPMDDAEVQAKFRRMARPHLSPDAQESVVEFVTGLERQADYTALFEAMLPGRAPA